MEIAMKMIAALIAGLLLSMTTFVTGLVIAITFLAAEESEHPLDGKDGTMLWSNAPVAVDTSTQAFERLPARAVPTAQAVAALSQAATGARSAIDATPAETRRDEEPGVDPVVTGAIDTQAQSDEEQASWRDSAHSDWCSRRYRSYDAASNSYRPYGGGERACESPYSNMAATNPTTTTRRMAAILKTRPGRRNPRRMTMRQLSNRSRFRKRPTLSSTRAISGHAWRATAPIAPQTTATSRSTVVPADSANRLIERPTTTDT